MGRKKIKNIIDQLIEFQKILEKKPPYQEMFSQIKMMNFKFKPIQGSLTKINFLDKDFIETLWSLGKLDEFFFKKINQIKSKKEKESFFNFFSQIYNKYQEKLNNIKPKLIEKTKESIDILEVEIFKNKKIKN
ncbi:MAG: hypothetical protein N2593_00365 [Patescibacteria group bacterium]|nr:hypothetical protein [Patescibacteria group bacterium]